LVVAVLCLGLVLPAGALGAQPTGTTRISGASAFFTSPASGDTCDTDHLVITLAQDAFRPVDGDGDVPPMLSPWFDVQVWHESGCEEPAVSDYLQQTTYGLEPGTYRILDLTAAYVRVEFPIIVDEEIVRTLTFNVAWVADGTAAKTSDRNPGMKVTGWEAGAHFAGTVEDTAGLIGSGDFDYASMGLGSYVMY